MTDYGRPPTLLAFAISRIKSSYVVGASRTGDVADSSILISSTSRSVTDFLQTRLLYKLYFSFV
jgi:hypothetical protein